MSDHIFELTPDEEANIALNFLRFRLEFLEDYAPADAEEAVFIYKEAKHLRKVINSIEEDFYEEEDEFGYTYFTA